jgi:hypothetical protein
MPAPPKTEKSEASGATGRRSTRLAITIPITMKGKDANGNEFREDCRTIVVNKHGAKIATSHQLVGGADVEIENRALGLSTRARVVWQGEKSSSHEFFEVGIQLIKADNIWGIQFPPEDWQEGPPTNNGRPKPAVAARPETPLAAATPPSSKPDAHPTPSLIPAKTTAAPVKPAANVHLTPSTLTQSSAELANLIQRFTRQAEGIASQQTKVFQENLESLSRRFSAQTQANLQEAAARAEMNAAKTKLDLEDSIHASEARLQSLRAGVEIQASTLEELRKSVGTETEMALQNIHEAGWQALEAATEELGERIKKELDTISADYVAESRKLFKAESADSRKNLLAEAHQQLMTMAASTAQSMNDAASEGLKAFRAELQKAAQRAQEQAGQELEEVLSTLAERQSKDLAARLENASSEIQEKLLAELHSKTEAAARETVQANAEREEVLKKLRQEALDAAAKASGEIAAKADSAMKKAAETVDKHVGSGVLALQALASKAQEQLQEYSSKMEEISKFSAASMAEQSEARTAEGLKKLRQDFDSLLERSRKQMDESTAAYQNKVMEEAQSKLSYVTERLAEDAAAQLTALTQDNLDMAEANLREAKERILNEWEETFRSKLAEVILPALKPPAKKSKPRESGESTGQKS